MTHSLLRFFVLIALTFLPLILSAQEKPVRIFLTRHAEKTDDGTKDPPLSQKGRAMATALDGMLSEVKIKAVYSTPYKRTKETVTPIAARNAVPVLEYDPFDINALLAKIGAGPAETVVVAGHGNTVPMLVNHLFPDANIPVMKEDDYGRLFVIYYYKDQPGRNSYFILNMGKD